MGDTSQDPRAPEALATLAHGHADTATEDFRRSVGFAIAVHALVFVAMLVGPLSLLDRDEPFDASGVTVQFREVGGEGESRGGGGGGNRGSRATAMVFYRARPEPAKPPEPRQAPIAPRKPRPLSFDELNVPDLPMETDQLFAGVFSPQETEFPGLSLDDMRDFGGVDTTVSSGTGGGIGGGDGTGTGSGEGWGVGAGTGGGTGGGAYSPGAWDIAPVLVFKPPEPPYPPRARERNVDGEVILRVLVKLDGSTQVLSVLKTLPHCVEAAKENAKLFRWKPALREGKPVETEGIISVTFSLLHRGYSKS